MPKGFFTDAVWKKGKKTIKGRWMYIWHRNVFLIRLDSVDEITGQGREIEVHGDDPEFNGWKLIEGERK